MNAFVPETFINILFKIYFPFVKGLKNIFCPQMLVDVFSKFWVESDDFQPSNESMTTFKSFK